MGMLERLRASKQPIKAVLYARFSSENQRDESIDAQVRAIKEFAKNNNINIIGKYIDRARSATTDDRPEFQRMIRDSSKKRFKIVLVHKLDRFARNRNDAIANRVALRKNDVFLISVMEPLDEDRPESVILESVLEAMAEYYSKNLAREVRKGLKENALKGCHTGGFAPLGYNIDPVTRKLVINEEEAPAVKMIFDMMLKRTGYNAILEALRAHGYKTKAGKDFGRNSLYEILHNPKYKGMYVYNRVSPANPGNKKRNNHKYNPKEEMIVIPDGCPAIVSEETFDAVADIMDKRKTGHRVIETYLLSGKIFCGECGARYVGNRKKSTGNRKPIITYRCNNRARKTAEACSNKEVNRDYLERFVIEMIEKTVFNDQIIDSVMEKLQEFIKKQHSEKSTMVSQMEKKIKQINIRMDNLTDILSESEVTDQQKDVLLQKIGKLADDKTKITECLEQEKMELESEIPDRQAIKRCFNKARQMFRDKTLDELQQIIDLYVNKIVVYKERIEVILNMMPLFPVNDLTQKSCSVERNTIKNSKK